jgi:hypothetical protein
VVRGVGGRRPAGEGQTQAEGTEGCAVTSLESLGVRNAEEARIVRGKAFEVLKRIDEMHATYGPCLVVLDGQEGSLSTLFLARWLELLDKLIELRDLLNSISPNVTAEGIPW